MARRLANLGWHRGRSPSSTPAAAGSSKLWPAERFGALARRASRRARRAAADRHLGPGRAANSPSAWSSSSGGAARLGFPTTLLEFAALARRAAVVVAADTGPLHLACAVGTPVVAIFGPTDPARNGPFDSRDVVVSAAPRPCFPCYRRECAAHAGVMASITVDAVAEAIARRLSRGSSAVPV